MASRQESVRPSWGGVLIVGVAIALTLIASVIAGSTFRPLTSGGGKPGPGLASSQAQANIDAALPMPNADIDSTVLDVASFAPTISGDQAIAIARANASHLVGQSPRAQLVSTTARAPGSPLDGFTGRVVLSTDVPGHLYGPITAPSVEVLSTYSWVFVSLNGEVVVATQSSYVTPESVPGLP